MDLPKNERTFEFEEVGDTTGKTYNGKFISKCILNISEKRLLEIEKTRLNADMSNPSGNLSAIATIISNLSVRIIEGPEWWRQSAGGLELQDENVLVALYDKCLDQEEEWKKDLKAKSEVLNQGN